MFGMRRPVVIMYLLAVMIFTLALTGNGSILWKMSETGETENAAQGIPGVTSVRTERLLREGTPWETYFYKTASPVEGPTVMVIGGIHGDERAGYLAADSIATWAIDCGTLLVIPRANIPAIRAGTRNAPGESDLNRVFPGNPYGSETEKMAVEILAIMQEFKPSWVLDLHEAEFCERQFPGALGQTVLYPREARSLDVVEELVSLVNNSIYNEAYHFLVLRGVAGGSAAEAADLIGSEALIVETCEQLSINERIQHQQQVVSTLLYLEGITVY